MRYIDEKLKEKLSKATQNAGSILPPLESLSEEQACSIIKRYTAAIEGNFLSWMAAASITARSVVSKFAADENLWVEIKDDHPSMLRSFAKNCKAEPDSVDFEYVHTEVMSIRNLTRELSGLKNITLMATLENTSAAFIPYMAELGKKLECTDFTYTDVHGEADIEHANQFLEALSDEQKLGYNSPEKDIDETISITMDLLKKVFTV